MKDRIRIDTEDYRRIGSNLQTLSDELSDCAASLSHVMLTNDAGGKLQINLSGALRTVSGSMPDGQIRNVVPQMRTLINRLSLYSDRLARSANQAADNFERTEHRLAAMQLAQSQEAVFSEGGGNSNAAPGSFDWAYHLPNFFQWAKGQLQQLTEYDSSVIFDAAGLIAVAIGNTVAVSDGKTSASGYMTDSREWSLGFEFDNEDKADRPRELFRKKSKDDNPLKDRVALFDLSAERTTSKSMFHVDAALGDESANAGTSVDFFKTTKNAKIYGGLGAVKENGKYQLAPGYGAEIGGSFSIFEDSVSTSYELIDNVSVDTNMTVTAGKVDGKAEAVVSFENGNVDVYAGLGGEALLGELGGDMSLNVGGVKGTIGATVNYGIGAKAEVGFHDGKLVYDVGATLGIGASVHGEIDVGGLVENVAEGLETAGSYVAEGFETVGSYVAEGLDTVGDAVSGFCESAFNRFFG